MSDSASSALERRLALFYALYFALLGCISPYWGLYLQYKAFDPEQIGILMAGFGLVRILAPNLWAGWSRYFRSPLQMVRIAAMLTLLCFTLISIADGLISMGLIMMLYGFFWAAMLPQYEVMTMQACAHQVERYSRIRVWGSVGFVLMVLLAGALLEQISVAWLPLMMFVLIAVITLNSFRLPETASVVPSGHDDRSFWAVVWSRSVLLFLLMVLLLQLSFGPYYTFFSIYLEEHGYSRTMIGVLWSVGVVAEVALFWFFPRLVGLLSWQRWAMLSLLLTALRWWLVAIAVDTLGILLLVQLVHAFSFAVMHAVGMRYVQQLFPAALQARGQALYASVGFGLGGAVGALISGLLWQALGGAGVFMLAALSALAGAIVAWYVHPQQAEQV